MTQSLIQQVLYANRDLASQMSVTAWASDQQQRAEKVRLFRQYADGDHRANLTPEMRKLLRISSSGSLNEFNNNYMDIVIQAMVDRLTVTSIEDDNETASAWAQELLDANRFDAVQADVYEAAVRDGDTYVMVYFDNDTGRVRLSHEPAYDGTNGMLVLYDSLAAETPRLAIKVWTLITEGGTALATTRVNVYYADRIERYVSRGGSDLTPYATDEQEAVARWVGRDGQPLGVPVVHLRNRRAVHDNYGMSEIENAIPLQDALNRTLYSMVMSAELSAFQIRYAVGFNPPDALTPGMWVKISPDAPLTSDEKIDIGALQQGELAPYLDMARYLANEIGKITRTPSPEFAGGDAASGEALKQRESGLLGKVTRFQTRCGSNWEDALTLAHRVQQTFGREQPPPITRLRAVWKSPELRNDVVVIDNALKVKDAVDERTFLQLVAPVFGWDHAKVEAIVAQRGTDADSSMKRIGAALPTFEDFSLGAEPQEQPAPGTTPTTLATEGLNNG